MSANSLQNRSVPKTVAVLLFIVAILVFSSCSPAYSQNSYLAEKSAGETAPGAPEAAPMEQERVALSYDQDSTANSLPNNQTGKRIVIKNASLTLVVNDPAKSMASISRMAEELGGFVVSANMYQQQLESGVTVPRASITIRIPAEKLNDTLDKIKAQSSQNAVNETVDSQDVTREYTDLQSRLRNLESYETQLTKFLEETTKTEDALKVYTELVNVREQIELIKGQIKYYEESAALSAISVELMANEAVQPLTIGGWEPAGQAKEAIQSLLNTLKVIVNAVIWIVLYLLPVLLVLFGIFVLPFILIGRWWRKRHPKAPKVRPNQTPPPPAKDNG